MHTYASFPIYSSLSLPIPSARVLRGNALSAVVSRWPQRPSVVLPPRVTGTALSTRGRRPAAVSHRCRLEYPCPSSCCCESLCPALSTMSQGSSSVWYDRSAQMVPRRLGKNGWRTGLPLVSCPRCGEEVIELQSGTECKNPNKIFFKCCKNEMHVSCLAACFC